jgi:Importin 13 repeat
MKLTLVTHHIQFSQHFVSIFYQLPSGMFDVLIQCSIASLTLQERYSMVAGCSFLVSSFSSDLRPFFGLVVSQSSILLKTFNDDKLVEAKIMLVERYGRGIMHGILCGIAGVSPRSVIPNLIILMLSLLTRCPVESRAWMQEILYAV